MLIAGKCVITFCIIFMMCPRRIRPALALQKHAKRIQGPITANVTKFSSSRKQSQPAGHWDMNKNKLLVNGIIQEVRADEITGFDLTDEEIIKFKIWPHGVIPYYIDVLSFKDKVLRDRIRGFLNVVNRLTGLNFLELLVPPKDEKTRWVFFINRRGLLDCADHSIKNFTNEGVQHVILGYDCMSTRGELAEAVLAIAGLQPQHNAPNRDEYIRVVEDNIIPAKRYLFEKLNVNEWLFHDVPYDFHSAGHYHSHKYTANGRATIETKEKNVDVSVGDVEMVQSGDLSKNDIWKIKMLYSYISKKKQAHIPECHKLFQRGKHFSSFELVNNNVTPQKKPNKYLGIADDEKNDTENDNKDNDKNGNNDSNDNEPNDNQNESSEKDEGNQLDKNEEVGGNESKEQLKDSIAYISENNLTENQKSKMGLYTRYPLGIVEKMKDEYSETEPEFSEEKKVFKGEISIEDSIEGKTKTTKKTKRTGFIKSKKPKKTKTKYNY